MGGEERRGDKTRKEALRATKRQFCQEPHIVTSQKTPFFKLNTVWERN
jgi:hypothetical protein